VRRKKNDQFGLPGLFLASEAAKYEDPAVLHRHGGCGFFSIDNASCGVTFSGGKVLLGFDPNQNVIVVGQRGSDLQLDSGFLGFCVGRFFHRLYASRLSADYENCLVCKNLRILVLLQQVNDITDSSIDDTDITGRTGFIRGGGIGSVSHVVRFVKQTVPIDADFGVVIELDIENNDLYYDLLSCPVGCGPVRKIRCSRYIIPSAEITRPGQLRLRVLRQ
jgi:hypothetical protein